MELKGSTFLVTGGSLGIGKATAKLLVEHGAKVMISARDKARVQKAAAEIGAIPVHADVATEEGRQAMYMAVQEHFGGRLDGLINNAGTGGFKALEDLSMEDFEQVFAVNVFGLALLTKLFVPTFKAQNSGNIVNIASTAALKGDANCSVYAASKFALRGMSQSWQAELRKHNVRVFIVNPSSVTTAFFSKDGEERPEQDNKLRSRDIAHVIVSALSMDNRAFMPELSVWATNPF